MDRRFFHRSGTLTNSWWKIPTNHKQSLLKPLASSLLMFNFECSAWRCYAFVRVEQEELSTLKETGGKRSSTTTPLYFSSCSHASFLCQNKLIKNTSGISYFGLEFEHKKSMYIWLNIPKSIMFIRLSYHSPDKVSEFEQSSPSSYLKLLKCRKGLLFAMLKSRNIFWYTNFQLIFKQVYVKINPSAFFASN